MVYFICKVNLNKSLYPRTLAYDSELPNLVENLVLCKNRSSWFACTMKTLISAVAEESRLDIFNEYEPFNFNFVLLFLKKTLVITTNLTNCPARSSCPKLLCIKGVLRNFTPHKRFLEI